jgi:16S rRNA (adenine(1408)-N(1))-methyltransferase
MALERAPGALEGLANRLTVLLPWGSLLRAVALGEVDGLTRLGRLCAPGAAVEIVYGHGDSELPAAGGPSAARVVARYAEAGLEVSATKVSAGEVAALPTTWAKRLAHSDRERAFWRLKGVAVRPGSALRTGS